MTSLDHARRAKISVDAWCKRMRQDGSYQYARTEWYKALLALEAEAKIGAGTGAGGGGQQTPSPPPAPVHPYGSRADAGPFAGRGIMLGSNRDVLKQALDLAHDGFVNVLAVIPNTPAFPKPDHVTVLEWRPPEQPGHAPIQQAEGQHEWDANIPNLVAPKGIVLNSWEYGRFPARTVALVECYYNEPGVGVDFGVFKNYMAQGATAVVPVCGGYSAGVPDAEAAAVYQHLATWEGGPFPGFWMYAGESMLTAESVAVLKGWKA